MFNEQYYLSNGKRLERVLYVPMTIKPNKLIPDGIEEIGNGCFQKQSLFKELRIPSSVRMIGKDAFLGVKGLEVLYIPESVEFIDTGAFANCEDLKEIHLSGTTKWGHDCLNHCPNLKVLYRDNEKYLLRYFSVHNIYAIMQECNDLSTKEYNIFKGYFTDIGFPNFPQNECNIRRVYFAVMKNYAKEYAWYDYDVDQAIMGARYKASELSYYGFFHKEWKMEDEISLKDISLLTGICCYGMDFAEKCIDMGTDHPKLGDWVVTCQKYSMPVYNRAMYAINHQRDHLDLLDEDKGLSWNSLGSYADKLRAFRSNIETNDSKEQGNQGEN